MSLLEGHADVVMDGVGPSVIPTVGKIRGKFNKRRKGVGVARQGAAPAARAGRQDGAVPRRRQVRPRTSSTRPAWREFNAVWERPEHLPTKAEITDPDAWMARVLAP